MGTKEEIEAYFDRWAARWDAGMKKDDRIIGFILDAAGVKAGASVLDVACGTGVLFPYYLERGVCRVTGVDHSGEKVRTGAGKFPDSRIRVVRGDMEALKPDGKYDVCVIYNAFPHFSDPRQLARNLSAWIRPGGRLTVAHGMSLEALHRHHAGSAAAVSAKMPDPEGLKRLLEPWFDVDTAMADGEKYVVSGALRDA